MTANLPVIPQNITVHLGNPDENAQNVTLPFIDYIMNVASSEIYPTWPETSIRANIYAQISYALNRIYTEYYRTRGYDFDITNSTAYDQSFVNEREIFDNIREIVGQIFNSYIKRQGSVEPLSAAYCDGVEVICEGLSQWGSVELANQGYTPYEILQYYYGPDIDIVTNVPVENINQEPTSLPLRLGSGGNDVRTVQIRLNRISDNFPGIPKIAVADGIFSFDTENAIKEFQRTFGLEADGIVGKSTWYSILQIYNAVKRLNELDSEGIRLEDVTQQFPNILSYGSSGSGVENLQYYISYLSQYYNTIPAVPIDGYFGDSTLNAVINLQNTFGLQPDGVVGRETWNTMYNAYLGIIEKIPLKYSEGNIIPFGGVSLRIGANNEYVRILQEYINYIAQIFSEVKPITPTGYFGNQTQEDIITLQNILGLDATGNVDLITWNAIAGLYSDLYNGSRINEGQYPGYDIGN